MAISVRSLVDDDTESVYQQALNNNLTADGETPYIPFSLRELITPQYHGGVTEDEGNWENWVTQHRGDRTVYMPTDRRQLITSVLRKAESDGKIRAVGSGHSHSNAPAPPDTYIDLNPGDPESSEDDGLNDVLENELWDPYKNHWLKSDDELSRIQSDRDTEGHETHPLDREHLKRVEAGVTIRRLNRYILHESREEDGLDHRHHTHENGYALNNMGSFDGQTIAGAINTSTHGTGVRLSSIADSVESVEIATVPESASGDPIVRMYRIEPEDGITDRESFEENTDHHRTELIQDDDVFYSTVVGYGCMGVAYAYTLHVRDSYWLREDVELMSWETLRSSDGFANDQGQVTDDSVEAFLRKSDDEGRKCRHTQILVNIATDQTAPRHLNEHDGHEIGQHEGPGNPLCMITRHYEVDGKEEPEDFPPVPRNDDRWPPERPPKTGRYLGKDTSIHLLAENPLNSTIIHTNFFHGKFNGEPFIGGFYKSAWYVALRRLRDGAGPNMPDQPEHYHPEPPEPRAPTTEVGVELGNIVDAVEEARRKIVDMKLGRNMPDKTHSNTADKNVFFPAPMGLRFTASSDHYLSPEYGRKTAMLEVPLPIYGEPGPALNAKPLQGVPGLSFEENRDRVVLPSLTKLHDHLVTDGNHTFDARPHMGKHNTVDAPWLEANYDEYDTWLDVYERFNRFGTFDNKFTDQLGINMDESESSDRLGTSTDE
jgi:hypothetical protein